MRLALFADVHMRDEDHDAVTETLERAVERAESFDPDRTVVIGDLIQDEHREADRRNVERVLDALAPLSPRYLAGNHDIAHVTADEFESLVGNDRWGHEVVEGTALVYLDTSAAHLPGARGAVSEPQLEHLRDVLADHDGALLFAHHPIHYHDLSDNAWFSEHPELAFCGNKAWIQRVLDDHGALAAFNGHVHELDHTPYRGVDHVTLNAINKERPDSETPTGTHALVTLDADRLRVEVYDADGFVREWAIPR